MVEDKPVEVIGAEVAVEGDILAFSCNSLSQQAATILR